MGSPLRKLAMKLLFFQILELAVEVFFNLTQDEDQFSPVLKVAQFDCSEMTENTLYAINQIRPCHITPEELEMSNSKVVLYTEHFLSDTVFLPCALEELGCETTLLDPFAYIWDFADNSAISILRTEEVNMLKQGKKFYVISGANSSSKFVLEMKNNPPKHCGRSTSAYPTNYDSLYLDRLNEGSDMETGRNLGRDQDEATKMLQYFGPKGEKGLRSTLRT